VLNVTLYDSGLNIEVYMFFTSLLSTNYTCTLEFHIMGNWSHASTCADIDFEFDL
jgi:hypothetical protein